MVLLIYQRIEVSRYCLLVNNDAALVVNFVVDFELSVGFITFECCC